MEEERDCGSCLYEKVICIQFGICLEDGEQAFASKGDDHEVCL